MARRIRLFALTTCLLLAAVGLALWDIVPWSRVPPFAPSARQTGPPNVVLISIDTLRADHLGAYHYREGTSPFIDSVAARGVIFDDVIVPVPATDPSHSAMLTGQHPLRTGLISNGMALPNGIDTLPGLLRQGGYRSAGVSAVYHLGARYGFGQGFDRYLDTQEESFIRNADEVNADAVSLIREHVAHRAAQPLFLFLHYFDVHGPYIDREFADSARRLGEPTDAGESEGLSVAARFKSYDSGIRFVDRHICAIWAELERAGLTDNTVLAITADHGEQLGEHHYAGGHADIYTETIRVPLIVAGPGIRPGRIPQLVSSMSIAPTLLELAGLAWPAAMEQPSLRSLLAGGDGVRGEPEGASRPLLVVGQPHYTRSVGLRSGSQYYIRNLEAPYRQIVMDQAPVAAATWSRPADCKDSGDTRVCRIPPVDFEPFRLSADVRVGTGKKCSIQVIIAPGLTVMPRTRITAPTRLTYGVARYDASFVTLSPANCSDRVTWSADRATGRDSPPLSSTAVTLTSALQKQLLTWRTETIGDEFYDVSTDLQMQTNRIGNDPRLEPWTVVIEREFLSLLRPVFTPQVLAVDEIERLRSLGYIR